MFRLWQKWQDRKRLAQMDATNLIARYGVRASYIARCRLIQMRNGAGSDSTRPTCHWKRVHSIALQLLPYDGDDEAIARSAPPQRQ
jgi:hypothetical protein